jgi:SAM-dependent methyltransferase
MPDHDHDHDHDHVAALADLLDLDGEALHTYWTDAMTWVRGAATHAGRVLDLGAGTGVATIALAQRFRDAQVIAVDVSGDMLGMIQAKALDLGLAHRIRTVCADLDDGWPVPGPVDLTWASMSLHHLSDPARVLGEVFTATRTGGLVAVAEFSDELRFLPDDLGFGRPGLEARTLDVLREQHAAALPHLGADWSALLSTAGFAVLAERAFAIDLRPPQSPAATRYACRWFERLRSGVAPLLADDDRDALDRLLDGDTAGPLCRRDDLHVRGTRTVTLARRPPHQTPGD